MNKEIYKPIVGFEDYQVSNKGNVKSLLGRFKNRPEIIMKPDTGKLGHKRVLLSHPVRKKLLVHRLVAEAFIPNIDNKPQINHIDNNPENNNIDNLKWCTASENLQHAQNQGRLFDAQSKGGVSQGAIRKEKSRQEAIGMIGSQVNDWQVVQFIRMKTINDKGHTRACLLCRCSCGLEKELDMPYLKSGRATKCSECSYKARKKHKVKI